MSKIRAIRTASILSIAVATVLTSSPATAHAQESDEANADYGDIVVTARKRSEDLLKTPVAISAMNSEMLDKQGIASVADLSASTPSMNLNNNNSGRNDRSFQQIIIRGFVPSNAQNPTTSTFIDGVPVSSATAFNAISDPERIEVLRGPQSAYFGRNTFAGAMNVVSKEPGDEFAGSLTVMAGTRNNYRLQASVEGPILEDVLNFRLAAGQHGKSGSYRNGDTRETLGDQMTRYASASFVATPADGLKIKALGLYSQDRDGAPANGVISAYDVTAGGQTILKGQSNCSFTGLHPINLTPMNNDYMCGTVKKLSAAPSANTTRDTYIASFLGNPKGRIMPSLRDYGLHRNYYHLHLNIDYEIGDSGFSVGSLTGMNRERYGQFSDADNFSSTLIPNTQLAIERGAREYFDNPFLVERANSDFSQELRLAFDNGGPLQGTVGISYLNNWTRGSSGGGAGPLAGGYHEDGVNSPTAVFAKPSGLARSRTKGAFFGLTYKFTPQFTVSAEGRYQSDTLYAYQGVGSMTFEDDRLVPAKTYYEGDLLLKETYKNFLPRVIAQYEFGREAMLYASWAKGVNPGQFNTTFLTRPKEAVDAGIAAGIRVKADPETVTNYEVGLKGRVLDNKLSYSIAGYFAQWRNQANLLTVQYPVNGVFEQVNGQVNAGSVDMKGVELDLNYRASDLISLGASGSLNDSKINKAVAPYVANLTGVDDFSGNEMPNTSKWSASANMELHGDIKGQDDATWFARVDYMFKAGVWSNVANIVRTADIHKVNLRAGVSRGPVSLDAFVTNLFNNKSFTVVGDNWLNAGTAISTLNFGALVVGLPEKRTGGLQMKYQF